MTGAGSVVDDAVPLLDATRLRRFAWRMRRGLLENDLVFERFLASRQGRITEAEADALDDLLDLTDPELLDLILGRTVPTGPLDTPDVVRVVGILQSV